MVHKNQCIKLNAIERPDVEAAAEAIPETKITVRQRVRPNTMPPTRTRERRQAATAAKARELLASIDDSTASVHLDDTGAPYVADLGGFPLVNLFPKELPSGMSRAIPYGTGDLTCSKDGHMQQPSVLVDAIDVGCSEIGRLSPYIAYFLRNSRARSTRRLYQWAWNRVLRSCEQMDRSALPMDEATAAMILVDAVNGGLVVGSIRVICAVISVAHAIAKQPDPTATEAVRSVMRGISRVLSHHPDRKVAIQVDELRCIRDAADADPNRARGLRDWALVAFGFAGAFRRSEIVARNILDLDITDKEMRVYLDRSKTDQFARGAYVDIKASKDPRLCPIQAIRRWLEIVPGPGPVFRPVTRHANVLPKRLSATSVSIIVKGFGIVLDLPEDRLGAHSLRAGMITALLESGLSDALTMELSRHKSPETLLKYYRPRRSTVNFTEIAGL